MKVSIHMNGRLEFKLYEPANAVEKAAMTAMQQAISKGQPVKVDGDEQEIAVVLSVEA